MQARDSGSLYFYFSPFLFIIIPFIFNSCGGGGGKGAIGTDSIKITENQKVNNPPEAVIIAPTVNTYFQDEVIVFEGDGEDPDGTIVKYEWDFEGDGTYDWSSTTSGSTSYTYMQAGTYNAVLRVTDDDGATATDTITVNVLESREFDRIVLLEMFVSTTCPHCASTLPNIEDIALNYSTSVLLLEYYVSGDANYYTQETYSRGVTFYGIQYVPTLFINGIEKIVGYRSYDDYETYIVPEIGEKSNIEISVSHSIVGKVVNITVNLTNSGESDISNKTLNYVIYEDLGSTKMRYLVRDIIESDTVGSLPAGEMLAFQKNSKELNSVNLNNIKVVVFLQDVLTKEVIQSAISE